LDIFKRFEAVQAFGATTQFAWSLWTAQQQHAEHCYLGAREVEQLLQPLLIFRNPAVGATRRAGHPMLLQTLQGGANIVLVQLHYWIAIRLLVAGID
jgi:hypothetical protein